jgi:tetratricopeptide (TPR) repeat protein
MDSTYNIAKVLLATAELDLGNRQVADSLLDETTALKDTWPPFDRISWETTRARVDGDREGYFASLKEATRQAPTPIFLLLFAREALARNRPREAWEAMRHLDPTSVDLSTSEHWRFLGDRIARALHMLGDHQRELEEVLRFRELWPDNQGFFFNEIRARAALREAERVEDLLEEATYRNWSPVDAAVMAGEELRAHGHPDAADRVFERGLAYLDTLPVQERASPRYLMLRFFLLFDLERNEEAWVVIQELLEQDPSSPTYLAFRGGTAAALGQREEALRIEALLEGMGASTLYLRACIAAELGERERAMALLEADFEAGRPFTVQMHTDPSFEPLWDYPPFQRLLEPKG